MKEDSRLFPGDASDQRGAALLLTFLLMLVLAGLTLAVGIFAQNSLAIGKSQFLDKQAFYIAEAGWQRGRQAFVAGTWTAAASPGNTYTESFGAGEYKVTIVDNGDSTYTFTAEGYVPNQTTTVARRRVVESRVSLGFTNLSLAATASASSSQSSFVPSNANDGDLNTKWQAGTNGPESWLTMDYGSATTLDRIVVQEDSNIDDLTIEPSDDSSTWTAVGGLSITVSGSGDNQTWTANCTATSHRYFRARFTSVPSNKKAAVKESESYHTTGPQTLTNGAFTTQW